MAEDTPEYVDPWDGSRAEACERQLRLRIEAAIEEGKTRFTFNTITGNEERADSLVAQYSQQYTGWQVTATYNVDRWYYITFERNS